MFYLQDYLKKFSNLPVNFERQISEISQLESQINANNIKIEKMQEEHLTNLKIGREKLIDLRQIEEKKKQIDQLQRLQENLIQQKVRLTDQMAEIIKQQIDIVNNDIRVVEDQLKQNQDKQALIQNNTLIQQNDKKQIKNEQKQVSKIQQYVTEIVQQQPQEPLYCICNRPSYGDMVGCDNEQCEKEWFHYACVGLTEAPEGSWYCQDCLRKQKKGFYL